MALLSSCYLSHERAEERGSDADATSMDASVVPLDAGTGMADAGLDASTEPRSPECVSSAPMVRVVGPSHTYRIDVTEVTEAEYARFLRCAESPPLGAGCVGGSALAPCMASGFAPGTAGNLPVRCVSWCAASAYCAWAGRRLCTLEEWMPACESTLEHVGWRGRVDGEEKCVLAAYADGEWSAGPADQPVPVATAEQCRGDEPPFDRLRDLVGNVEELVGDCPGGVCTFVGNSFSSGPNQPCIIEGGLGPRMRERHVGFRCCADARR